MFPVLVMLGLAGPVRAQVDVLPPVLMSVSLEAAEVAAGDTVRVTAQATDATGLQSMQFVYVSPLGPQAQRIWISTVPGAPETGELPIPPTLTDGRYELSFINLYDTVSPSNSVTYRRDGQVSSDAPGAPTTHDLDLTALDFSVVGNGEGDALPPALESVELETATVTAGDVLRIRFTVADATGFANGQFVFLSPQGPQAQRLWISVDPGSGLGEATLPIPPTLPDGLYRIDFINMMDSVSPPNTATYYRDGRVSSESPVAPTVHELDLSVLDFTVTGNGGGDSLPPVLESVALAASDLVAGDVVAASAIVSDESGHQLTQFVYVTPLGPSAQRLWVSSEGSGTPGEGRLTIPRTLPDGVYALSFINVYDTVSPPNSASYARDGTIGSDSPGAPTTHDLDLSVLDFTLTGNELRVDQDQAPPDPELPIEVEVTPVDEMEPGPAPGDRLASGTSAVFVSTTVGTLTSGGQTGARVQAQHTGAGRYVALLRSGQAGTAVLTVEINDRPLPPLSVAFVENRPATATTLAGPATGQTGQTLTYTASVTSGTGTPTGTVSFRRGGVEFATGALNGQGVATGGGSFPAGTHQITAHYLGATGFAPSASAARSVTVSQGAAGPLEFVGGGSVFEFTPACAAGGWANTPHPARLRYGPGEVNGMPSQVGVLFPSGAEHLQVWQPLAQSTLNHDALGRQMWTLFVLQQPFPRMTPVQRRITAPANGTDIAQATEVMLRLRVSGFGGIPGCGATVAGVLRRAG